MTAVTHSTESSRHRSTARPAPQWWALSTRSLRSTLRNGEFVLAVVSPVFLAICFYLPLRTIMNKAPDMNYAEFLMPIVCLQSVGFVATSAAMRSATDAQQGIATRLRAMPIPTVVPSLARLTCNSALLAVSLVWATIAGLVMGWRPHGGVPGTIGFFAVTLVVGVLLALAADCIGLLASSPQATSQAMALPQLILGMLSTGFVPEERFPDWVQPFARNQPISQFVAAMRGFDAGTITVSTLMPAVGWAFGIAALTGAMIALVGRRRDR